MRRILSLTSISFLAMFLVVQFCSCSVQTSGTTILSVSDTTSQSTIDSSEGTVSVQDGIQTSYPFTYTDAYGQEIVIESEPSTVVSVSPSITEIMFDLGIEDMLIGRSDYCDFPQEALYIESVGNIDAPNVERIVELDPDIVLASSIFSEEAYNTLTGLGITVAIVKDETELVGVFDTIELLASMLNRNEEGQVLLSSMHETYDSFEEFSLNEDDMTDAPSVYYCMGFGEYGDFTAGGDTYINDIIETAGATNVASDVTGWSYSVEALIASDPDYILIPEFMYDDFISSEPYSSLSAVQEGRVYDIESRLFERQAPCNLDAVLYIHEIITE